MGLWRWVGLGLLIDWRLNRHDQIREEQAHPKEPTETGYPTWLFAGILLTLFSLPVILCVWSWAPLRVAYIVWLATVWTLCLIGVGCRWREVHS